MKELKLIKGCGRTGNFIICLLYAITYAKKHGFEKIEFSKIHWSPNPSINKKIINDFFNKLEIFISKESNSNDVVTEFTVDKFYRRIPLSFEERIDIIKQYIKPIMNINPQFIGDNDLVIHLRSGDIMVGGNSEMIQPPLEFYKKVIESNKWNKIYVITEREPLNPIYNVLKETYENVITFVEDKRNRQNGYNFKKDFDYLIGAKHYIPCQSSLCPFIIQISDTIKNVYVPSYYFISLNSTYNWWTSSLFKKKDIFYIRDIKFLVYDYDKYIKSDPEMYRYNIPENKKRLLNYNSLN
jgi:hypothetical protein